MNYQVLARKWRPRDFTQVVGQGHVLRALVNALDSGRLHHAYLFTGTRGVGKTTLARIFAKSLNCELCVTSRPCGCCSACREVDEGRFVDLIEVDAASRTKVDETRELLDNVQYAPSRGRYKVYLIDEVHMFSNHSFNALLKTLEEPPPHVKFLLATTDPKRLPITILSRCLQFSLKRLGVEQIEGQLAHILDAEGVAHEAGALRLIATAADGSMRDALSLLDQALAFGGGTLAEQDVAGMLGTLGADQVLSLVEALAAGDGAGLIARARALASSAPDFAQVLGEMLSLLRRIAVVQTLGADAATLEEDAAVTRLADAMSAEDCQLYYQLGLLARRDLPLAPEPQAGFEMALLRMLAFRPVEAGGATPPAAGAARPASTASAKASSSPAPREAAPRESAAAASPRAAAARPAVAATPRAQTAAAALVHARDESIAAPAAGPEASAARELDWAALVERLDASPLARELARNAALRRYDGRVLELVISPTYEQLRGERTVRALEQALQPELGHAVSVRIGVEDRAGLATPAQALSEQEQARLAELKLAIDADPNVQALQREFGASIERIEMIGSRGKGGGKDTRGRSAE
ncbi:MAG TPA: DNA polymerase III subunit gamma/tau [Gammaproteobacteria bacterium]|nr:DNA polymerase III subunit gamma/tau [Gammaproteobacteria bacterium]